MNLQQRLDKARADLEQIPALYAGLPAPTDPPTTTAGGAHGKVTGSPSLVRLDVLSLTDERQKDGWHGEDPRLQQIVGRYGVVPTLEAWVRVLSEEMAEPPEMAERATAETECAYLLAAWEWISEQQWATELADDVSQIVAQLRQCVGIRRDPTYRCPRCNNHAELLGDWHLVCSECSHDESVRDLEGQMRRRAATTADALAREFGIEKNRIHVWKTRGKIRPAPESQPGRPLWFPWDVFRLINPDIAEAFDLRDQLAG